MLGKAWAAAAMLLAAGLAGCIGGKDEAPIAPLSTAPKGVVLANETAAPDGRGQISAFKESNYTETNGTGAMMHSHDLWGGQTRRIIWQDESGLIPLPLVPDGKAPGTAIADYDIPAPNLVYEGTDHLEILFRDVRPWGAPGGVSHPYIHILVDYLTAADEPGKFRTAGEAKPD